jgi:hypothetical protein
MLPIIFIVVIIAIIGFVAFAINKKSKGEDLGERKHF